MGKRTLRLLPKLRLRQHLQWTNNCRTSPKTCQTGAANLAEGKLEDVNDWLKTNIHSKGDLYDPEELIKQATGTNLDSEPYLQYLNKKYGNLYGF